MKQKQSDKASDNAPKTSANASSSTAQAPVSNAAMQETMTAADPFDPMSMLDAATVETGMTDPTSAYLWATRTAGLYDAGYSTDDPYDTHDEKVSMQKSGRDARRAAFADTYADSPVLKWLQERGMGVSWAKNEHDLKDGPASMTDVPLTRSKDGKTESAETYFGTNTPVMSRSAGGNEQANYRTTDADLSKNGDRHVVRTDGSTTTTSNETVDFSMARFGKVHEMTTVSRSTEETDTLGTSKRVQDSLQKAKVRYQLAMADAKPGSPLHTAAKAEIDKINGFQERLAGDPAFLQTAAAEATRQGQLTKEARMTTTATVEDGSSYAKGLTTKKDLFTQTMTSDGMSTSSTEGSTTKTGLDLKKKRLGKGTDTVNNSTSERTYDNGYTRKQESKDETSSFRGVSVDKGLVLSDSSYNKSSYDSLTGRRSSKTGSSGFNTKDGFHKAFSEEERDAQGNVTKQSASGKLNADGASGKASTGQGKEYDHGKVMATTSADGGISVKMVPVKGKKGSYKLITTVRVGFSANTSGELNSDKRSDHPDAQNNSGLKVSGSLQGGASAGMTLSHTRILSAQDAKKHFGAMQAELKAVEKGGVPKVLIPQFEQLKKARAWAQEDGSISGMGSALGRGQSAKEMKTGDEVSLVLEGSVSGNAGLSAKHLGIGRQGSESVKRTLTVTRLGKGKTQLAVSFEDESMRGTNGSVSYGEASGKMSDKSTSGTGQSVTFVLADNDVEFDHKYAQITGTASRAGLVALKKTFAKDMTETTASRSEGHSRDGEASIGKAKFNVGQSDAFKDALTIKKGKDGSDQTSYKATGSNSANASVALDKYIEFGSKNTESADATVDAKGNMGVDITETTETTGLANPLDSLPKDGSELWKRAHNLDKELKKTEKHLSTFKLSDADVRFLIAHAGDTGTWQRHAAWFGPRPFNAWNALATSLQSPTIDPEWAAVDKGKAVKLAQAKAIATFMRTASGDGREIVESAVRNWSSPGLTGGEKGEFPEGLALTKKDYEALKADGQSVGQRMMAVVTTAVGMNPDGSVMMPTSDTVVPQLIELDTKLAARETAARDAIVGCTRFKSADTKAEMLDAISKVGTERRLGYSAAYTRLTGNPGTSTEMDDRFRAAGQRAELRDALTICTTLKAAETRHLAAAEEELGSFFSIDGGLVNDHLGAVEASWDRWIAQVKKARLLYRALGREPGTWKVSADGSAKRSATHEPDVARYNAASAKHATAWKSKEAERAAGRVTRLTTY